MSTAIEAGQVARSETEAAIARAFAQGGVAGVPIYLQFQNAIRRLVQEEILPLGAQMPSDTRLAGLLGISLGTIQKALGNLANQGWVRREHGRGTFIASPRPALAGAWHFRFRAPETGERLPVYSKLLARRSGAAPAMVAEALGDDASGFVEIARLFDIGGRFFCFARLWLGARRFARLLDYPAERLENVNLKDIFAADFDAPTISVAEHIRATSLDPEIARHLCQAAHAPAMRLEVTGYTRNAAPFSFQEIFIPATDCVLDISPSRPAEGAADI